MTTPGVRDQAPRGEGPPPYPPVFHKDSGKVQTENTLPKRSAMKGGSKEVPAGAWWANARVVAGAVVRTRPNNVLLNIVVGVVKTGWRSTLSD